MNPQHPSTTIDEIWTRLSSEVPGLLPAPLRSAIASMSDEAVAIGLGAIIQACASVTLKLLLEREASLISERDELLALVNSVAHAAKAPFDTPEEMSEGARAMGAAIRAGRELSERLSGMEREERCLVYEGYCPAHGFIHGAEAEELRVGVEKIASRLDSEDGGSRWGMDVDAANKDLAKTLLKLLADVDARDSVAYLEAKKHDERRMPIPGENAPGEPGVQS